MYAQLNSQAKASKNSSCAHVPSCLLQRHCACGQHTIVSGECEVRPVGFSRLGRLRLSLRERPMLAQVWILSKMLLGSMMLIYLALAVRTFSDGEP